ncbi:MMPL family transporter [Rhodopirellula sp. JC740]|uniref:MMPL family transporter n=1 Tax=Rhodopirellula halodulae TaxID=2894198 RepID=A0ABS8NL45_9BACT|nr:MMPL family transporter [Rhodopirellula sp. JC740]MCC9643672.1 MMPL family transporter [Rhodopirellula sp. JC740]
MKTSVTQRFSRKVIAHSHWIVLGWVIFAVFCKTFSPAWKEVALDGDFEYLPATQTSVAGGHLLDEAFLGTRARSQMVVTLSRAEEDLTKTDRLIGLDLLRRLYHRLGEVAWQRAIVLQDDEDESAERWWTVASQAFDQAIEIDSQFYEALGDRVPETTPTPYEPRLAIAYWDRGNLLGARAIGQPSTAPEPSRSESTSAGDTPSTVAKDTKTKPAVSETTVRVAEDLEAALILDSDLPMSVLPISKRPLDNWEPLLDIYSWEDRTLGSQLKTSRARLAVLTLSSELAATGNIELLEQLQEIVDQTQQYSRAYLTEEEQAETGPPQLLVTGSAAIGGQTLAAARSAIQYTEWFTVVMILLLLAIVYRAPLLVAVPLFSIAIAVMVSTAAVTFLTQISQAGWMPGLDVQVYTTSRIFVIVILFGAGTDYCLFLIARLREEAAHSPWPVACRKALTQVSGALIGSAMTTIVGLGMLWFADFGKFHHTGPIIAVCLSIALLVCMTLTPACLLLLGPKVFWPTSAGEVNHEPRIQLLGNRSVNEKDSSPGDWLWNAMAIQLTRRPFATLMIGLILLLPAAWVGFRNERTVTYDISGQLASTASTRQGMGVLAKEFGIGQMAPISVLLLADQPLSEDTQKETLQTIVAALYQTEGVTAVRHRNDPLGDFPPDREMSLLSSEAWRRRALQNHRLTQLHFVSSMPEYTDRLIRLDVIVQEDPFSVSAGQKLEEVEATVQQQLTGLSEAGLSMEAFYAGTTPSIVDLREVTLNDTFRIKIAVIAAVFVVLVLVIRRVVLSSYLIATVLLSYYTTLGLTYLFFRWVYGPTFPGLDWKLPIFLFVILVAVGQDYNVYLVTRILEEKRRLGSLAAVRRAVARTGGIITACGLVMAATFISMTASSWWPWISQGWLFVSSNDATALNEQIASRPTTLRGITELGFALGLGVLLDTLYVRTVLVPSFVVLHDRWRKTPANQRFQRPNAASVD